MLTLHLVRHGETEASGDGVFCGDLDPPLTSNGKEQAERLAQRLTSLGLSAIYVSPKLRARMTAEPIVRATSLSPRVEEGLREISYGEWEGRKETEIRSNDPKTYAAWASDPAIHSPPVGET